jgi:predicted proteasome-type protease
MTYCVGLLLNDGIVMLSDTRTNAGLDNIATYRKMFQFEVPRTTAIIVILTAGSLSDDANHHRPASRGHRRPGSDDRKPRSCRRRQC